MRMSQGFMGIKYHSTVQIASKSGNGLAGSSDYVSRGNGAAVFLSAQTCLTAP
jgi:hypothetical protein